MQLLIVLIDDWTSSDTIGSAAPKVDVFTLCDAVTGRVTTLLAIMTRRSEGFVNSCDK